MKAITTWILVADGGRAYVVERKGAAAPRRVSGFEFAGPRKKSREIGTDRPGRVFRSAKSVQRASIGDDKKLAREAEQKFLIEVAAALDRALARGSFAKLVLIAPPRVLGVLRRSLSPPLVKALAGEIRADLVNSALGAVNDHLAAMARA
jgi:protein required for attachment to host cells